MLRELLVPKILGLQKSKCLADHSHDNSLLILQISQTSLKYQGSEHGSDSDSDCDLGRGLEITESEDDLDMVECTC